MTSPGGVHGPPTHFPIGRGWTAAACAHTRRRSGLPSPRCSYATPAGAVHLSICRLRFVVRLSPAGAASGRRRPRPHDMGAARGARAQGARDALANVRLADLENTRTQFPARTAPARTTHGSSQLASRVWRAHARTPACPPAWFASIAHRDRVLPFYACVRVPVRASPSRAARLWAPHRRHVGTLRACRARAPSTPRRHARPMTQAHGSARRPSAMAWSRQCAPPRGCVLGALAAHGGGRCCPRPCAERAAV